MNKLIRFYCVTINNGSLLKIIFEAIVSNHDIEGDCEWVDININKHCNDFSLDLVIQWGLISTNDTHFDVCDTKIIETINGHLFFEDSVDWQYYRIGKNKVETSLIKKETNKIKRETNKLKDKLKNVPPLSNKRDYESVWIDQSGNVYDVGFAGHESFASDWLMSNRPDIFETKFSFGDKTEYSDMYSYEILQNLGFIRILGWSDPPNFVLPNRITPKQKQALRNYCISNNLIYGNFPEILKS